MKTENKDAALVLSGGGARGMAHIGAIRALEEQGFNITSIAGTSIGSLIGGIYLAGKLDEFVDWVTNISKLDILKFMDFAISKSGFIKGEKIFKKLKPFIGDARIEELPIPYAAVAVDIQNHKEIIFREGPLFEAIRASVAIPTVLRPYNHDGHNLVDGGVSNPLPLDVVKRNENDLLIAIDLNADTPYHFLRKSEEENENMHQTYEKALQFINEKWSKYFRNGKPKSIGFFDLVTQSIYAMQMKLTQVAIEQNPPNLLVKISRNSCDMFEFHRAEEMIEYGKKQMESAISNLSS